jgi:hypothetical protein
MVEVAVLSAILHGNRRNGAALVLATLERIAALLDADTKEKYAHYTLSSLKPKRLKEVENLMQQNTEPFISDYARDLMARGKAEGKREDLLKILKLRGFTLSAVQEATITQCSEAAQLERWFEGSLSTTSVLAMLGV